MLKRLLVLLLLAGGQIIAMEWMKSKIGYGSKKEVYTAGTPHSLPNWYWEVMFTMPMEWPTDESEQRNLVNNISEFAKQYLYAPKGPNQYSKQQIDELINFSIAAVEREPDLEYIARRMLKQREVLKKALEKYQELNPKARL